MGNQCLRAFSWVKKFISEGVPTKKPRQRVPKLTFPRGAHGKISAIIVPRVLEFENHDESVYVS